MPTAKPIIGTRSIRSRNSLPDCVISPIKSDTHVTTDSTMDDMVVRSALIPVAAGSINRYSPFPNYYYFKWQSLKIIEITNDKRITPKIYTIGSDIRNSGILSKSHMANVFIACIILYPLKLFQ